MGLEDLKKGILSTAIENFSLPDFVSEVQGFSLGLRLTHWETKSYAEHKAVEMIQETMDGLLDDFVEAYVGYKGGSRPTFTGTITKNPDVDKMITCLKGIGVKDTSLLNIRDEMLSTCYKLKYLLTLK